MAMRSFPGKLVVVGILALAVGGTFLLNVVTAGPNRSVELLLPSPTPAGSPPPTVEVTPSSGPAEPGRGVVVRIQTDCGFVPVVDFDGSFWHPGNGRTMAGVGIRLIPPVDPTTVTLQAPDSALLRTASGEVVILVRSGLATAGMPVCD
jgi:hypothetical protein